jgi:hypothetical protein
VVTVPWRERVTDVTPGDAASAETSASGPPDDPCPGGGRRRGRCGHRAGRRRRLSASERRTRRQPVGRRLPVRPVTGSAQGLACPVP